VLLLLTGDLHEAQEEIPTLSCQKMEKQILFQFVCLVHLPLVCLKALVIANPKLLNAVDSVLLFDNFVRCLFALEHVTREFEVIKSKLQTMLEVNTQKTPPLFILSMTAFVQQPFITSWFLIAYGNKRFIEHYSVYIHIWLWNRLVY
jgi:hypothetical protein